MKPEHIIFILVVLFIIYIYYTNQKENYSSNYLPERLNKLSNINKEYMDKSYFLNDIKYIDNNKYILQNKNISNYETVLLYIPEVNNPIGLLSKIPNSDVYHFILFNELKLDNTNEHKKQIKILSDFLSDIIRKNSYSGSLAFFIYIEIPYITESKDYGIFGMLMIYYQGRLLYNQGDEYYYVNKKEGNNYITTSGNNKIIEIVKKYKINNINLKPHDFNQKTKVPFSFELENFVYFDKQEQTQNINKIFVTYSF